MTEDMPTVDGARAEAERRYPYYTPLDAIDRTHFVAGAEWLAPTVTALEAEVERLREAIVTGKTSGTMRGALNRAQTERDAERARADAAEAVIERVRRVARDAEAALWPAIKGDDPTTWAGTGWWHVHLLCLALSDAAPLEIDPLPFVWPSGVRSMFTHGDCERLTFAPRPEFDQDPSHYPLSRSSAHPTERTVADLLAADASPQAVEPQRVTVAGRRSGKTSAMAQAIVNEALERGVPVEVVDGPEVVETAEELDALPVGSVVLDYEGEAWQKVADGLWVSTSGDSGRLDWSAESVERRRFRVLYRPDATDGREGA